MRNLPGVVNFLHLKEVDSTQTLAKGLAETGAEHGTLILADQQTAGYGRMGAAWHSPSGGIYFSLILRPSFSPQLLAEFNLMAAQAVAVALRKETELDLSVKPPNDILARVNREEEYKKICGILAEARTDLKGQVQWLILGVGLNVNCVLPRELPHAASLYSLTHRVYHIGRLLRTLLQAFDLKYKAFAQEHSPKK